MATPTETLIDAINEIAALAELDERDVEVNFRLRGRTGAPRWSVILWASEGRREGVARSLRAAGDAAIKARHLKRPRFESE